MKYRFAILSAGIFLVSLLGCDKINSLLQLNKATKKEKAPAPVAVEGTVIAKVNNTHITLEDLNEEVASYNAVMAKSRPEAKITTREQKVNYLKNEMLRRLLLYQDALAKGMDRNPDVLKALEKTRMDLLVMELVREEAQKVDVSSKEIEEYYNTYKEQLKEPEERQIREIMLPTEEEAKEILIQLLQGADFATLAKEKSKAASSKDGGDLGFISRGKKFPQFDAVAFSDELLDVGKISNIFKGPEGYYIIKLEARRGGKQKSLNELWDDIKRGLTFLKQQQKIEDLLGKLSREAKIEIYEGEIK